MNEATGETATLRAMLDERGAEYTTELVGQGTLFTIWADEERAYYVLVRHVGIDMWSNHFTPEQAVAATLGRPTWRNSYDQKRYDRWYNSLFHGEPTSFKELIEDIIWTTETVDLGPNGNECQGVDEGEANTESLIDSWAGKAAALREERDRTKDTLVEMCNQAARDYIAELEQKLEAATLGSGECEWELVKSGPLHVVCRCSACGYEHCESTTDEHATELDPSFCPRCGASVRKAVGA